MRTFIEDWKCDQCGKSVEHPSDEWRVVEPASGSVVGRGSREFCSERCLANFYSLKLGIVNRAEHESASTSRREVSVREH